MRTLLLAAILYLIGVVVILLLRPRPMFDQDGHWKEFGTLSKDHTIFPFWLFCITWAVLSYCITLFFTGTNISTGPAAKTENSKSPVDEPPVNSRSGRRSKSGKRSKSRTEELLPPPDNLVEPLSPIAPKKGKSLPKPGYYVLNNEGTKAEGAPKYVYYGTEPPDLMGEE